MGIHAIALLAALIFQGPGKLEISDVKEGAGRPAQAKDLLTMEYTGTLTNGKQFDTSKGKQPFTFVLGMSQVIQGWDQGLVGMKVGGKRHLVIPPDLAYGKDPQGDAIPANSTLVFDVELLRIDRPGDQPKLELSTVTPGKGDAAQTGDEVTINWIGTFLNGKEFVNTYTSKKMATPILGSKKLPPGINLALEGIKVGEKRHAVIPYELAYGESGQRVMPPFATIVLDIEAVSILTKAKVHERDLAAREKDLKMLKIEEEVVGKGKEAKDGDTVDVHYTGTFPDGKKFDSSRDRNMPLTVTLGTGQVIRGFDLGIQGMKVGGKRKVTIPSELAYGSRGAGGGVIPPNQIIIFEIELVTVK
jgi:FKBP-type peptidyl-prolyl cis-trans isomerase